MNTQYSKEAEEILDGFRLLDDDFMTRVFDKNPQAAELVIQIILGRDDLRITELTVQKVMKNPVTGGRDLRLDIFCIDKQGINYNVEVQRARDGADPRRARFHSAVLDTRMLRRKQKFETIKESYVIFITETDVIGKGEPVYQVSRYYDDSKNPFGDGNHIVYVNGAYHDDESPIGRLMHDFRSTKSEGMYNEILRNSVHYYKETEGGRLEMCDAVEAFGKKVARAAKKEGIAEGIEEGRKEGIETGRKEGLADGVIRSGQLMNLTNDQIKENLVSICKVTYREARTLMIDHGLILDSDDIMILMNDSLPFN